MYDVPGTVCPERAITRLVKPAGSLMPFASGEPSAPYGLVPGCRRRGVRGAAPQGSAEHGGGPAEDGRTQEGTTFHAHSQGVP